ncbi:MAG: hypothetical protein AAB795_03950 [Patescibacteria group bacterium]
MRIQNYLDRLERLAIDKNKKQKRTTMPDGSTRPRALSLLREMVFNTYVRSHKDTLAVNAVQIEERAARQLGIDAHYDEEQLAQRGDVAVKDLEGSLDQWISYLSDLNEPYPTWFRYYVFRNILELGEYDKDKGEFTKRSAGTNRLFPDIDRGALARIEDIINCSKDTSSLERFRRAQLEVDTPQDQLLTKDKAQTFAKLSFAKQYAESIKEAGEITPEMRAETNGTWVKYQKDADPTKLWASLQNKGTAWCTKGFATAEVQLKRGDFYVYYTLDKHGKPTIPRIAIRMQGDSIFEVRGVADTKQNLEGNMTEIAEAKMNELPGKEKYQKISADMKYMSALYEKSFQEDRKTGTKTYLNPHLTKDDLTFLYELNAPIEGFGYQKDPRIAELRSQRNPAEDMLVIFECTKEQIAHTSEEISETTKAYLGPLQPHTFNKLQQFNIEHVYTSFPEGKIQKMIAEIGGKTADQLIQELKDKHINISKNAEHMLHSKDFTTLPSTEQAIFIRLHIKDLGCKKEYPTTEEIYERAEELGLELCPAETGPQLRLQSPTTNWMLVAMKQITDRDGYPDVFNLHRDANGLWLDDNWAESTDKWLPDNEFVFRFRKLES